MLNIALAGPICSGKSTIAALLVDLFGYRRLAFAGPLKSAIAARHGITVDQLNADKATYRAEMQEYGTAMREFDPLHWCKELGKVYDMERYAGRPFVVDDLRYHNEAEYLREHGFIIVKVATPKRTRNARHRAIYGTNIPAAHQSEIEAAQITPDIMVQGSQATVWSIVEIVAKYCARREGTC